MRLIQAINQNPISNVQLLYTQRVENNEFNTYLTVGWSGALHCYFAQ